MSRIFFGDAGDYTYFCAIPGHRGRGHAGRRSRDRPPITLAEAEAKGKP